MPIAHALLAEFDQEMASTRRVLERVPDDRASWRPHPKSWTLGELATHVSNLPSWASFTLAQTELDINPPGGPGFPPPKVLPTAGTLEVFDGNVTKARSAIAGASDGDLMVTWTLKNGGAAVFSLPRTGVLRSFVMNHLIHHRGQLTVYLRLCNVPLPQLYGPTADAPR